MAGPQQWGTADTAAAPLAHGGISPVPQQVGQVYTAVPATAHSGILQWPSLHSCSSFSTRWHLARTLALGSSLCSSSNTIGLPHCHVTPVTYLCFVSYIFSIADFTTLPHYTYNVFMSVGSVGSEEVVAWEGHTHQAAPLWLGPALSRHQCW